MRCYTSKFETPHGSMLVAVDEDGNVVRVVFPNEHDQWADEIAAKHYTAIPDADRCAAAVRQLIEYFAGKRRRFDLPLKPGGTAFQQKVWTALTTIPYGTTITYRDLARRIGNPAAVRAVGRANATNPIPIIIPCHRVIGADGSLTGFGGGLPLKEVLLRLEGVEIRQHQGDIQQLTLM